MNDEDTAATNEREALADLLVGLLSVMPPEQMGRAEVGERYADALLAAGFHLAATQRPDDREATTCDCPPGRHSIMSLCYQDRRNNAGRKVWAELITVAQARDRAQVREATLRTAVEAVLAEETGLHAHADPCDAWRVGFNCNCWRADLDAALAAADGSPS